MGSGIYIDYEVTKLEIRYTALWGAGPRGALGTGIIANLHVHLHQ